MKHNYRILTKLLACADGINRANRFPTMRDWWETCKGYGFYEDMMWLIGRAVQKGNLPPQRAADVLQASFEALNGKVDDDIGIVAKFVAKFVTKEEPFDGYYYFMTYFRLASVAMAAGIDLCPVVRQTIGIDEVTMCLDLHPGEPVL